MGLSGDWDAGLAVLVRMSPPAPYRLCQMTQTDVPEVIAKLLRWYPEIAVGAESPHLQADFYTNQALLEGVTAPRDVLPLVLRHARDGVVALTTFQRHPLERAISSRVGVLAPEHRSSGFALLGPMLLEELGRAIGAELAYYFVTLRTRHQQVIAERRGFQLAGIVPGRDLSALSTGEVKRSFEGLYTKLLVPREQLVVPPRESLTARTREVWAALFGASEFDGSDT